MPILEPVYPSYYAKAYSAATKEATLNLLAHMLTDELQVVAGKSASAGIVSSKTVGSVSVSYEARSGSKGDLSDWLKTTRYGQRFLLLTATSYGGFAV